MRIDLWGDYRLFLLNFTLAEQTDYQLPAREIYNLTAGKHGFPQLRSRDIYIFRNLYDPDPRYLSEPSAELISLTVSPDNKPIQFAYQLAHETSHLLAQNWERFRKPGYYTWVEEALCGAHSIFCLRELAKQPGWWQAETPAYLSDYIDVAYTATTIDAQWYRSNAKHLVAATALTPTIRLLSRLIADEFPNGEFVSDNIALIATPPSPIVGDYLRVWQQFCKNQSSVPALLISRLEL